MFMKLNTAELAHGKFVKGSSALSVNGKSFYSYTTHVAEVYNKTLMVNPVRYSNTTSKQMCYLKRAYQKMGYDIVNWCTGEVIG